GRDGLEQVRRLTDAAPRWLAPGGQLLIEMHRAQARVMTDVLHATAQYARAEIVEWEEGAPRSCGCAATARRGPEAHPADPRSIQSQRKNTAAITDPTTIAATREMIELASMLCPAQAAARASIPAPKGRCAPISATGPGKASRLPNIPPVAPRPRKPIRPIATAELGVGARAAMIIPTAYIAAVISASTPRAAARSIGGLIPKASAATAAARPMPSRACRKLTITCASSTIRGETGVTAKRRRIPARR